jgi:hypothetical protein
MFAWCSTECAHAVKCKGPSIFDSCNEDEDEDLKPITTWAKKDSTKIAEETRASNLQDK